MSRLKDYVKNNYHPLADISGVEVAIETIEVIVTKDEDDKDKYHSLITAKIVGSISGDRYPLTDAITYQCWSTFVGKTLQEVPAADLPITATFRKVQFGSKEKWTIE